MIHDPEFYKYKCKYTTQFQKCYMAGLYVYMYYVYKLCAQVAIALHCFDSKLYSSLTAVYLTRVCHSTI